MKTPKWLTWDEDGTACVWERKPHYLADVDEGFWCGPKSDDDGLVAEDACFLVKKRGGPKAIRRIRLERI